MSTILVVSQDAMLLETRTLVLRHTGAHVLGSNASDALAISDTHSIDLVVLCHSIPEQLRTDLVNAFRERTPPPHLLLVARERFLGLRVSAATISQVGSSDPSALIRAASQLLAGNRDQGIGNRE